MADPDIPTPLTSDSAVDTAQAPSLCTHCGLCCMGAIHVRAVLDNDEVQAASAIGLPVQDRGTDDRPTFALPCPKLVGTACSIFGHRPRVCSRYECQLLYNYRMGDVTLEEATAKVAIARDLMRSVRSFMPNGMSLPEARRLTDSKIEPKVAIGNRALMELRLRVTALEVYLDRNFRHSNDGQVLEMKLVEHG